MEFAGREAADFDVGGNAEFGGELGDVAEIFEISPKLDTRTRFFL